MSKTILFDLDGTLIDSTPAILDSFDYAFKKLNLKAHDHNKICSLIGLPLDLMFENLEPDHKSLAQEFIVKYRERYFEIYLEQTTLLPYAKEAILLAKDFAKLGVVTTKSSKFSDILLDFLSVKRYFGVIIGREDVEKPKPDKEPILKALSALNAGTNEAFMIGDTHLDILAAKAANIACVALSCGYEDEKSLAKFNIPIKENPLKAVEYIKNL